MIKDLVALVFVLFVVFGALYLTATHVEVVNGLEVAKCITHDCYKIGDAVFYIK